MDLSGCQFLQQSNNVPEVCCTLADARPAHRSSLQRLMGCWVPHMFDPMLKSQIPQDISRHLKTSVELPKKKDILGYD